ncbi:35722_t:CDS:2 [Gigaspora margarita]|uniref:35722_t:CDS:1 n=1 Tax=Gigaspora margarita TaxID=4874 RepID=A0ABM8VY06_GIGMA|nr:35722_t:CDS:2 [Gigaspora margarita]
MLNSKFKIHEHKENDKDLVDNIIDIFEEKVNTLVNNEDNKIPFDEKKIIRVIKKNCFDPVQEYCKTCKRDDYDENRDYNSCWHFKKKIDYVEVFEFAKFFKKYCNEYEGHYAMSNKDLGSKFEDFCKKILKMEFTTWNAKVILTGANINEVESTIRVGNTNIEGIRKGKFDAGVLVGVLKQRIQKSAYNTANLSEEEIIVTTYIEIGGQI